MAKANQNFASGKAIGYKSYKWCKKCNPPVKMQKENLGEHQRVKHEIN